LPHIAWAVYPPVDRTASEPGADTLGEGVRTDQEKLLRNLAAAMLSIPILAAMVAGSAVRRSAASRVALIVGMVALVGAGAVALAPREVAARPTAPPIVPVVAARLSGPLRTDATLASGVTIDFTSPMDAASVQAALRVEPQADVTLTWTDGGRRLVVTPSQPWDPSTVVTVTVGAGARDASGAVLSAPVRSSFVTRPATAVKLAATKAAGKRIETGTAFTLTFDHPVDLAAVKDFLKITPAVKVKVAAIARAGGTIVTITPATRLKANTTYTVSLVGTLRDRDGAEVATLPRLVVRTTSAPTVVRFRPVAKTTDVARDAVLSVRFTDTMDRKTTAAAFKATVKGKAIAGKVRWAEDDTVLVFTPKKLLPYGTAVVLTVSTKARSASGTPILKAAKATFKVEVAPAKPKARTATKASTAVPQAAPPAPSTQSAPSAGTVVGGGAWASVERYFLTLMNCTRTGGWVASNGSCTSPGGRDVEPLVYDGEIAAKVARPYAKYLAERAACDHFLDGNPGTRLRRAGFEGYRWAENIGCPSGDPHRGAISTQLFFQSEKPYNGGHYVNLMNAAYTHVGIGVWVHDGSVRIVSDFYTP
jgi:uncharacterized protein YkwD